MRLKSVACFRRSPRRANADMQQAVVVSICAPQVVACSSGAKCLDVERGQRISCPDLDQRSTFGAKQRAPREHQRLGTHQPARIDDPGVGISTLHEPMMPYAQANRLTGHCSRHMSLRAQRNKRFVRVADPLPLQLHGQAPRYGEAHGGFGRQRVATGLMAGCWRADQA